MKKILDFIYVIIILTVVILAIRSIVFPRLHLPQPPFPPTYVDVVWSECYFSGKFIGYLSSEQCESEKALYIKRGEAGKEIGCGYRNVYCISNNKKYNWDFDEEVWVETEQSKACSKYADLKVSDLPVKCLDYFGLKN